VISQIVQALGELDGFVARAGVDVNFTSSGSVTAQTALSKGLGNITGITQHFQHGGRISGPGIVGERGPELFIPDQSGFIIPNHQLMSATPIAGGSVTNVYVGTVYGFDDFSAKVRDAGININRLG
jgi:hypothetical protein